jgi:hypothetical protein
MATKKTNKIVEAGSCVLIRTVTHYYVGRITEVTKLTIHLEDAAWVADTGRFTEALTTGTLGEVEPFPDGVLVFIQACVDISPWAHELPREVK